MDFKSVLSRVSGKVTNNSNKAEQYLAVKISSTEILATVWKVSDGSVTVGDIGNSEVKNGDYEGLLASADAAISAALNNLELPQAKTIFGVNPDWIIDGKIVDEKLSILRRLCKELDLQPLGYVLLNEAIESYLKEIEGAPLTAILIGLDSDLGWVTLLRAGKNLGTIPLTEGENLAVRVDQALHKFTQIEVLPARMILFDGRRELKTLEEKIMAYPWAKQLPFLHFPKVEVLTSEAVTKAVAIAGGTQMGGKIDLTEISPEVVAPAEPELEEISAQEAGFVQEGDFGKLKEVSSEENSPPEEFITTPKVNLPKISLPKITLPAFSIPKFQAPKIIFTIVPLVLVLVLGLGALVYFVPKANVYIHVTPQAFNKELTATISGQTVNVSEIGSKKSVSTGKKLVGDKAKGSVTIYSASSAKTLAAGTQIVASDGLKFTLDQDTAVASASDFLTPASVNAKVTAVDIGDKYNLSSGTKFTISGLSSSYLAKNDSAISGGSSHQATVVTKVDQDRLFATLSAELTVKAQNDLNTKLSSGQTLLPNAITFTVAKKRFSNDIDTESETVSLDLTLDFTGVTVSQDDLLSRFLDKYSSEIPSNYQIDRSSAAPEINSVKMDKAGNAMMSVALRAKLLPQLNNEEIINTISGKNMKTASDFITQKNGVSSVEVTANPKIFQNWFKYFLPWKKENIKLEIISD